MFVFNHGATRKEREKAAESLRTKCGSTDTAAPQQKNSKEGALSHKDLHYLVDEAISAEHEDTGMLVLELIKFQRQGIGDEHYFNALKRVFKGTEIEGVKKAAGELVRAYYVEKSQ